MSALLAAHVAGGSLGLASGVVAAAAAKGGKLHRVAGLVFVGAMLTMAAAATVLALVLPDRANLPGGVFSLYLVSSGWAAGRRQPWCRQARLALGLLGLVSAAVAWKVAREAYCSATGTVGGKPLAQFVIFAMLASLAVGLDAHAAWRGGAGPERRLRGHVWRMCLALFFASGSFLLGQQQVMPVWMRGSPVLAVLAVAPLGLMLVWMARMRGGMPRLRTAP